MFGLLLLALVYANVFDSFNEVYSVLRLHCVCFLCFFARVLSLASETLKPTSETARKSEKHRKKVETRRFASTRWLKRVAI